MTDLVNLALTNFRFVVFDLDRTIEQSKTPGRIFPHGIADREVMPGRRAALWALHRAGVKTAIATNQGGAAWGLVDIPEFDQHLQALQADLLLDGYRVCYHHPKGRVAALAIACESRKPNPGMLLALMGQVGADPQDTLMVGDLPEDQEAAKRAGCFFMWAWQFFGDEQPPEGGAV